MYPERIDFKNGMYHVILDIDDNSTIHILKTIAMIGMERGYKIGKELRAGVIDLDAPDWEQHIMPGAFCLLSDETDISFVEDQIATAIILQINQDYDLIT